MLQEYHLTCKYKHIECLSWSHKRKCEVKWTWSPLNSKPFIMNKPYKIKRELCHFLLEKCTKSWIILNKTPGDINVGCVGLYLQSLWFYVENNKFNADSSYYREWNPQNLIYASLLIFLNSWCLPTWWWNRTMNKIYLLINFPSWRLQPFTL